VAAFARPRRAATALGDERSAVCPVATSGDTSDRARPIHASRRARSTAPDADSGGGAGKDDGKDAVPAPHSPLSAPRRRKPSPVGTPSPGFPLLLHPDSGRWSTPVLLTLGSSRCTGSAAAHSTWAARAPASRAAVVLERSRTPSPGLSDRLPAARPATGRVAETRPNEPRQDFASGCETARHVVAWTVAVDVRGPAGLQAGPARL
jgi:hypothetical protein